jgi:hypothetical protein
MPVVDNRELLFQQKLLEKYGKEFGVSDSLRTRLMGGSVTDAEHATIAAVAVPMVMRFQEDLRNTPFDKYSALDVDIILRMVDANHKPVEPEFDPRTGQPVARQTISKIIPESKVAKLFDPATAAKDQVITGFMAPSSNSENLSPQQMISQFGLDYQGTSYLSEQGGQVIRQPYAFSLDAPMNSGLLDCIKIPFDPRLYAKMEQRAQQDPAAAAILGKYQDEIVIIAQGVQEKESLQQRYPNRKIVNAADPPYLGTSASMSGGTLASLNPYAAIMQEHYLDPVPAIPEGTKLTLKLPLDDPSSNPERGDVPAGVKTVPIAEFREGRWWKLTDPDTVAADFKQALLRSSVAKYDPTPFERAFAQAQTTLPKEDYFPEPPKKMLRKSTSRVRRGILLAAAGLSEKSLHKQLDRKRKKTPKQSA